MATRDTRSRILAATDLRPHSDEAIKQALAMARGTHRVAICHVMPEVRSVRPLFPQLQMDDALAALEIEAFAREEIARALDRIGAPDVDVFLERGAPHVGIVERARAWRADLVVVAAPATSRSTSGTAESVSRLAKVPVLVARPSGAGPIVVGSDLSEPSLRAVEVGANQAQATGRPLVVIHAIDAGHELAWLGALRRFSDVARETYTSRLYARVGEAAGELGQAIADIAPGARGDVEIGEASEALTRRAKELDASLLVVATQGRTGLDHVLVGSVAEAVIANAPCSVLVVRDVEREDVEDVAQPTKRQAPLTQ
jgi:nucleotide-binding universal stress UspA family protein